MFERLNGSFTMGEDASIVAQMKPEFKDSTRQSFSLSAPLRHSVYIRTVSSKILLIKAKLFLEAMFFVIIFTYIR